LSYILDTNIVIALLSKHAWRVRQTFIERTAGVVALVPSIVAFELWFGVAKSAHQSENAEQLATFLSGTVRMLAFDSEDARVAGGILAGLEAKGTPIGPYDLLIAAQALRREAILVTANVREFGRVEGLALEDWTLRG
jgi:tRNA(fMet)-specific endonuclease VapC